MENKGIEELVDAVEGVVAGNRVGQIKILAEPFFFGVSKFLHVLEAFAAADNGTQGDEEYVGEVVFAGAFDPWIFHLPEDKDDGWKRSGVCFFWFLRCGHP